MGETVKNHLKKLLEQAVKELRFSLPEVDMFVPDEKFGDYATNVALIIGKKEKKNPKDVAKSVIDKISEMDSGSESGMTFDDVLEAGGFINFKLSQNALLKNLADIHQHKENYGSSNIGKGKKILVEYFQPNIAKPLHLGHLRTAIIGDCLFRLFKFTGFSPESDTHLGDWGTQFGLLVHAFKKYGDILVIEQDPINELNKLYIKINAEAENDASVREQGKAEFVKLEQGDKENRELWKKFKDYSWQEFEIIYRDLGVRKSDHDWPESFFEDKMPAVLLELKNKGLLKESQGAQVVDLEEYKLGTALLVKSDGGTTYLLRDLATLIYRKQQGFEKQYYVVDVRQSHTLKQTFKIIELLGYINPGEAVHVSYGFLTLPQGAMSTRKGTTVGAKEFIEDVQHRALEIIEEKNRDLKNKEAVAKQVASGAIKYFDLSHNIKSDIVFDPKKAISFEGNTGPYLQYTHARIHGILRKFQISNFKFQINSKIQMPNILNNHELSVLRKLHQFPEIVEQAAEDLQPNTIANYLFELSQNFNAFYQEVPVLQEPDEQIKDFRLKLITGAAQVIKNGLLLLGIEAPEEM
ncbi:MAG: arginine--tRNA ligase [Patescibacteria group bacterium]|mgnify:CR=1 FL=1